MAVANEFPQHAGALSLMPENPISRPESLVAWSRRHERLNIPLQDLVGLRVTWWAAPHAAGGCALARFRIILLDPSDLKVLRYHPHVAFSKC
jgi:hypothetical protein